MTDFGKIPALIMAGGFGKRLRPLTDKVPKPMVKVGGKPIIYWQIKWLESYGIERFVLLGGYRGNILRKYIESIGYGDMFDFSIEKRPLGTAGAIKNAEKYLQDCDMFIVSNGDNVTDQKLTRLRLHNKFKCCVSLVPYRSSKGIANVSGERILGFEEKPLIKGLWYNAGGTLMCSELLDMLPREGSLEIEIFPILAKGKQLSCAKFPDAYFSSVDSMKDREQVDKDLKAKKVGFKFRY